MEDTEGRWTADQVLALAPDAASRSAGARLAAPAPWSGTGTAGAAVWGLCAGSGSTPYRTVVDLSGPAFSCSCPSRKFPCKHALGLMFLWSDGQVPEGAEPAGFAQGWLASRAEKATGTATAAEPGNAAERAGGPADPAAAAKRVALRRERVAAGLDELDQWLGDQIRTGLSGLDRAGYAQVEQIAARMVDAQAPAVA